MLPPAAHAPAAQLSPLQASHVRLTKLTARPPQGTPASFTPAEPLKLDSQTLQTMAQRPDLGRFRGKKGKVQGGGSASVGWRFFCFYEPGK